MTKKERILFFIETGGPGGAEKVVLELLEGFRDAGHEVFLTTLRTGWLTESAIAKGFLYYPLRSDKRLDISLPFRLSRLINLLKADILHSHLLDSNFYAALASRIARVKHIGTEHGDIHHVDAKKHINFKLKVASSGKSLITAVSEFSANKLKSFGISDEKIVVVPNPVKKSLIISDGIRASIREQLGIPGENIWLWTHVGNIRPVKDQRTMIEGFAESVNSGYPDQRLLIIGDGKDIGDLEGLAASLNVADKVAFAGHRNDIERVLPASDGFIMSSLSESMPMALLEAIASGLYPICSDVGGISEVVPNEQLYPVKDVKRLAELCSETLENRDKCRDIAANLKRKVVEERSMETVIDRYLSLYRH